MRQWNRPPRLSIPLCCPIQAGVSVVLALQQLTLPFWWLVERGVSLAVRPVFTNTTDLMAHET
jgi:hypothetical protein